MSAAAIQVIELVGTPGAGKTTVLPFVEDALRASGATPRRTTEIARDLAARGWLGALARALPGRTRHRALWAIYVAEVTASGMWLVVRRLALARLLARQRLRPREAFVKQRRVVKWFIRQAGTERVFRRRARDGEVLVMDEGYLHRVVQLFASPVERPEPGAISRYLDVVPHPAAVVVVRAPTATCLDRIRGRGAWEHFRADDGTALAAFVENAAAAVAHASAAARTTGMRVIPVDNAARLEEVGWTAQAAVQAALPLAADWRFQPSWAPPRPGTALHIIRKRSSRSPIERQVAEQVANAVGASIVGGIARFPAGRRSAIVRLETDAWPLALKRYADEWPAESIRHEHAVLHRLAEVGFPSVRLVAASDGRSAITVGGRTFAVFELVEGKAYGGRRLSDARTEALFSDLGRLLALLHRSLEGFDPGHRHHLGIDPRSGHRIHDAEWHRDRFREMAGVSRDLGPAAEWLGDRASDLEALFVEVEEHLSDRPPVSSLIHGDFGVRNIVIGKHGPVVLDFELARTEWRLTEIVMVLAGLRSEVAKRAVVQAYRCHAGLDDGEWALLGDVWRHHALTGAVRAWDSWVRREDPARLDLARTRAARALDPPELARWL